VYSEALEPDMMGRNSLNVNTLKQDVTIAVETQVNGWVFGAFYCVDILVGTCKCIVFLASGELLCLVLFIVHTHVHTSTLALTKSSQLASQIQWNSIYFLSSFVFKILNNKKYLLRFQ